jgi:Tol biopolymer transport system component
VASVDGSGTVTGVAVGSDTVTTSVVGESGARATASVSVGPNVQVVGVEPTTFGLEYGDTLRLVPTVEDLSGAVVTDRETTWTSSDPNVATVSDDGLVTGTGGGTVTITASVQGVSASGSGTVQSYRLRETVMVVDSTRLALLSSPQERSAGTYRFEWRGVGGPPEFEVGDVLVGAQGLGFLRRVTAASGGGGEVTLETEAAVLDDAIEAGEIAFNVPLFQGPGFLPSASPGELSGQVRVRSGEWTVRRVPAGIRVRPMTASAAGFGLDFSGFDVCKYVKENDPSNACPSIIEEFKIPNGSFNLDPSFDFGSTWQDDRLIRAHGVVTAGVSTNLAVSLGAKVQTPALTREATLVEIGRIIYLQVGAFPVVVHAEMEIKGKFEAQLTVKGKLQAGVSSNHTVDVGGRWDESGGFTGVLTGNGSFTPQQPSISDSTAVASITLEAKVTLTPSLNLKFYGIAGPEVGAGPWAKATMTASTTDCGFDSNAGLEGSVGIALADFLKKGVPNGSLSKTETLATFQGARWQCPVGDLQVETVTTGTNPDTDGYTLQINGKDEGALASNDTQLFGNVRLGTQQVGLVGIADNCSVQGANPLSTNIQVGQTAPVTFTVDCRGGDPASTGEVTVSVSTTGQAQDGDGYQATIGGASKAVPSAGSVTFTALPAGAAQVALGALAPNCSVQGANPLSVTFTPGAPASGAFTVDCTGGDLMVSVGASGPFPAASTLSYSIDGTDQGPIEPGMPLTATLVDGAHDVELTSVPSACTVDSANPVSLQIPNGGSGTAAFQLTCTGGDVTVAVATNGDNGGQSTYRLVLDGGTIRTVAANGGSVGFTGIGSGDHTLELTDVPQGCTVEGPNPRTVSAPGQEFITVNCEGGPGEIVFRDVNSRLWVMRGDGTDPRMISSNRFQGPRWSPDGGRIAASVLDGTCGGFVVLNADGSGQQMVLDEPCGKPNYRFPEWYSDGSGLIAFEQGAGGSVCSPENALVKVALPGGGVSRVLASGNGFCAGDQMDWSPDGSQLLLWGWPEGSGGDPFMYSWAGSGPPMLLAAFGQDIWAPRISPDGTQVAYLRFANTGSLADMNLEISLVTGGAPQGVVQGLDIGSVSFSDFQIAWSPDGKRLVFPASIPSQNGAGLWLVEADGSNLTLLRGDGRAADWR